MQILIPMLQSVVLRLSVPPPNGWTGGSWTLSQPEKSFVLLWTWGPISQSWFPYRCLTFTWFSLLAEMSILVIFLALLTGLLGWFKKKRKKTLFVSPESNDTFHQAQSLPACESYPASSSLWKCPGVSLLFNVFIKSTLDSVLNLQSKGPGLQKHILNMKLVLLASYELPPRRVSHFLRPRYVE